MIESRTEAGPAQCTQASGGYRAISAANAEVSSGNRMSLMGSVAHPSASQVIQTALPINPVAPVIKIFMNDGQVYQTNLTPYAIILSAVIQ